MSTWLDWEERQNGSWEKFTAYVDGVCQDNMHLLDESLINYILTCFHSETGINSLIRVHAIGMVITSVFGSLQEPINIIVNDEGWQKWSHMADFNKACAVSNSGSMPDLSYIWYRCSVPGSGLCTLYDVDKNAYNFGDVTAPVDFNVVRNEGKPFILPDDVDYEDLNDEQRKLFTAVAPASYLSRSVDKETIDKISKDFNGHNHLVSQVASVDDNGNFDVRIYQSESPVGVYVPLSKITNLEDCTFRVLLPEQILEKYNIPILK